MIIQPSKESIDIVIELAKSIKTFHHHYHILFDIAKLFGDDEINYVEIGAYHGGSASLMMHRPNSNIVSIDLGFPAPKDIALSNTNRFNKYNNNYVYIQGDSKNDNTVLELKNTLSSFNHSEIDILFIDGDHSYHGAYNDFIKYNQFVRLGGYIIFDDYMDSEFSPDVKHAVDDIAKKYCEDMNTYSVIGCLENTHKAYPETLMRNNCFIFKKNL